MDYALIPLGRSPADAIVPLCTWGTENMAEITSISAKPQAIEDCIRDRRIAAVGRSHGHRVTAEFDKLSLDGERAVQRDARIDATDETMPVDRDGRFRLARGRRRL